MKPYQYQNRHTSDPFSGLKLVVILFLMAILFALMAHNAHAQTPPATNSPAPNAAVDSTLVDAGKEIFSAASTFAKLGKGSSNWIVAPYVTVFPNDKNAEKLGGGVFVAYKVNQYVSAGLGLDYLGQLWMPSGDVNLKYPTHPLSSLGWTNFTLTPFAIAGVALPIAGAGNHNGGAATIAGAGATTDLCKFAGGTIEIGGALVNWSGAGIYNGKHYQGFLAWKKSF